MADDFNVLTGGIESMTGIGTQKILHLIFLVDNSGSMRLEHRMDAVNEAFQSMIPALQKKQEDVHDAFRIYLSIMAFNEDPEWVTTPVEIVYYVHTPIEASQYVTYYSRAYQELGRKLSRKEFFSQTGKMAVPYIMLLTDGAPTQGDDYESILASLKNNGWFRNAKRYAVLIGEDTIHNPDARKAVSSFVDSEEEGILDAPDAKTIMETVSGKTLVILDEMTQHRGVGTEKNKLQNPDPFPPVPDPQADPAKPDPDPLFDPNFIF